MAIVIYLSLGMCVLGLILALDGVESKGLNRWVKGKNISMPDPSKLMFWKKKKR